MKSHLSKAFNNLEPAEKTMSVVCGMLGSILVSRLAEAITFKSPDIVKTIILEPTQSTAPLIGGIACFGASILFLKETNKNKDTSI